jgi:hypothetical protein
MNATLHFQRGPLFALLAVFFLALGAALAPGLAELDTSGFAGGGGGGSEGASATAPAPDAAPAWVTDPLEPPLAGMEGAAERR